MKPKLICTKGWAIIKKNDDVVLYISVMKEKPSMVLDGDKIHKVLITLEIVSGKKK